MVIKTKRLKFNKKNEENFNTSTATGKMMINFMAIMSQYERDLLLERQREGIKLAKEAGKYKGRQRIKKPDNFDLCYQKYAECSRFDKYTFKQFMMETGLKKATLMRMIAATKKNRTLEKN